MIKLWVIETVDVDEHADEPACCMRMSSCLEQWNRSCEIVSACPLLS